MKLFTPIRWLCRSWRKTARGKWHIIIEEFPLKRMFVPACRPWAIWKATSSKNHTAPEGETVCKICAMMLKDGLH